MTSFLLSAFESLFIFALNFLRLRFLVDMLGVEHLLALLLLPSRECDLDFYLEPSAYASRFFDGVTMAFFEIYMPKRLVDMN